MSNENYLYRKERMLHDFDRSLNRVKPLLFYWFGKEKSRRLIRESRQEYEALVPRIPFIGRNSPLLVFFLPTPRYLAVYRTLQRQGATIADAGYLAFEIGLEQLKAIPSIALRTCGYIWFSQRFRNRIARGATVTHQRRYAGNYVMNYVDCNGQEFDYGVDYIECATCKFPEAEGALELAPYICAVDEPASELLGWGLTRTKTLAEGADKCDFRFKKGGPTQIDLPQSLKTRI